MSNDLSFILTAITGLFSGVAATLVTFFLKRQSLDAELKERAARTEKQLKETEKVQVETKILNKKLQDMLAEGDKRLQDLSEKSEAAMRQERFRNFTSVCETMEKVILDQIENKRKDPRHKKIVIDLKLISVAMVYSWHHFIDDRIPAILRDHLDTTLNLSILMLDHKFLESLDLSPNGKDWAGESYKREGDMRRFLHLNAHFGPRLCMEVRKYRNLPHWHGWLVDDSYLFMGRAKWSFTDPVRPILQVGQNEYRYYDHSSPTGSERIDLFQQWHRYYTSYASEPLMLEG